MNIDDRPTDQRPTTIFSSSSGPINTFWKISNGH